MSFLHNSIFQHLNLSNETIISYKDNDLAEFTSLGIKFDSFHQNSTNILLHCLTTPLGIFGFLSLVKYITKSTTATSVLCLTYLLNLVASVPLGVFLGTFVTLFICLFGTYKLRLGLFPSIVLIALAYVLQDLAHMFTGEQTLQSSYSAGGHIDLSNLSTWSKLFSEHAFFLLPLCVSSFLKYVAPNGFPPLFSGPLPLSIQPLEDWVWVLLPVAFLSVGNYCIDSQNGFSIFPGSPYFKRIHHVNFATDPKTDPESRKVDLNLIRTWALKMMPPHNQSSHWWVRDLDPEVRDAFNRCANSTKIARAFRSSFSERHYCLDVIDLMNEVYVTGPPRFDEQFNSDQIFYTKHVDGPYGLVPFVSVYRCIVGMDKNMMITTRFPMAEEKSLNACEGDVLIFDYNREVHYITSDESKRSISDEYRVVLKLHYCVYPRILAPLGWLMSWANTRYNIAFRALFLKTINPVTLYEKFLAWNVVFFTNFMTDVELYVGQRNIIYLAFALLLWYTTGSYEWFLFSTSFVHYIRYIGTYYYRGEIDYGSFKRDVFLFKCISIGQVIGYYLFPSEPLHFKVDPISIAMIVIGYAISVKATIALGVDRTYFGAELGKCEPKWINEFPYGYIPHPMIVSQIFALLGFYKADHFRASCPYLIHCHIAFYMTHMLQEHLEIWHQTVEQYFSSSKKIKLA